MTMLAGVAWQSLHAAKRLFSANICPRVAPWLLVRFGATTRIASAAGTCALMVLTTEVVAGGPPTRPEPDRTTTSRSDDQVIVPFADEHSPELAAFISTGFLFGSVFVDTGVAGYGEFKTRLRDRREELNGVRRPFRACMFDVGGDWRVGLGKSAGVRFALLLSYRMGYVAQVRRSAWETVGESPRTIGGGPDIDASGPRAMFGAGIAIF